MEKDDLSVSHILKSAAGASLKTSAFGRSEAEVHLLSEEKLRDSARALKEQAQLDWLENLSAVHSEKTLVFTYFLRSSVGARTAILRVSAEIPPSSLEDGESWVKTASVAAVWPMAAQFEEEIERSFGVRFTDGSGKSDRAFEKLDEKPKKTEFPLRKTFVLNASGVSVEAP